MSRTLTKQAKVNAEKARVSQLTNQHSEYFKVILSHQIENRYCFNSINRGKGSRISKGLKVKLYNALSKFIDDSLKMTITEVENKYARSPDCHDATHDPESDTKVEVEHFALFSDGDTPVASDSIRLHGYFRTNGGYFVVTRVDWFHDYH
jgi:hypothetical protein